MKKLISVVIPVCNEEKNISLLYASLTTVLKKLASKYRHEIIFINDGSSDKSGDLIEELAKKDSNVKYIEFSRNFGKEIATSAGLQYAKGNGAVIIDADLQHPSELIPEFVKKWEEGAEMVIGVREKNQGESFTKKLGSFLFHKIMNAIGEVKTVSGATDYRLVDKIVIEAFGKFTERQRMTAKLLDWLGFKKDYVYFKAGHRSSGKASYSTSKLIKLAFSSFIGNSLLPLKIAGYLGVFITVLSGALGIFIFFEKYLFGDVWNLAPSNLAILVIFILFLVGIVLSCLGLIALYIANIYQEAMNRPMYIVRKKKNI